MKKTGTNSIAPLIRDSKYEGTYVALRAPGKEVIAYGPDVGVVIRKARKAGVVRPAVVFVPEAGATHVY